MASDTKSIGEVCRLVNGRAFKPSDWSKLGLPIVRIQNLNDESAPFNHYDGDVDPSRLIKDGDVLLSWSGTPGTSFGCFIWNRGKAILNQHIFLVHLVDGIYEKEFFVFAVNSVLDEMISQAHGAVGLRHITKGRLEALQIPYFPKPEQQRVVARIRECLSRVEEMQRLREETLAETPLVEERFLAELEDTFEDCSVPLRELLAETQNGKSLQNKETAHNGKALTLSAVRTHRLDMSASKPVQINVERDDKYLLKPGDVLISRSNTRELVALSAIAPDHIDEPTIFSDLLIRLTPKPRAIRPLYLTFALRMPGVRHQLRENAVGSSQTMVKISGERLRTVEVPCPSPAEQEKIEARYAAVTSATSAITEELDGQTKDLESLRESILREAFAGNL